MTIWWGHDESMMSIWHNDADEDGDAAADDDSDDSAVDVAAASDDDDDDDGDGDKDEDGDDGDGDDGDGGDGKTHSKGSSRTMPALPLGNELYGFFRIDSGTFLRSLIFKTFLRWFIS